jgi:hypothetical protein
MRPTTAVATWPGAVSVSWFRCRAHDGLVADGSSKWTLVLEAIDGLRAPPFEDLGQRFEAANVTI